MTFDSQRITSVVLILGGIVFGIGASLPTLGEKGNFWIFTLPVREHLLAVAEIPNLWRWANVFMGAAAVVLLGGLVMLTTLLPKDGLQVLPRLAVRRARVSRACHIRRSVAAGSVRADVACWLTLGYSAALLELLLLTGDTLPVFHHAPPLLISILLLVPR